MTNRPSLTKHTVTFGTLAPLIKKELGPGMFCHLNWQSLFWMGAEYLETNTPEYEAFNNCDQEEQYIVCDISGPKTQFTVIGHDAPEDEQPVIPILGLSERGQAIGVYVAEFIRNNDKRAAEARQRRFE